MLMLMLVLASDATDADVARAATLSQQNYAILLRHKYLSRSGVK
jgi:hypothetical protein